MLKLLTLLLLTTLIGCNQVSVEQVGYNHSTRSVESSQKDLLHSIHVDYGEDVDHDDDDGHGHDHDDHGHSHGVEDEKSVLTIIDDEDHYIDVTLYQNDTAQYYVYLPEQFVGSFDGKNFDSYVIDADGNIREDSRFFIYQSDIDEVIQDFNEQGLTIGELSELGDFEYGFTFEEWSLESAHVKGQIGTFEHFEEPYVIGYIYSDDLPFDFMAYQYMIQNQIIWLG